MSKELLRKAVSAAKNNSYALIKYITANDTGSTGAHQAGFHIHKNSWPVFFSSPGEKGSNKDKFIKIRWQDSFETDSRFIYYGKHTRSEYRLTRFGRGFPFLQDEHIGDLLILIKITDQDYEAYVFSSDDDIDELLTYLNIPYPSVNGLLLQGRQATDENSLKKCFKQFIDSLKVEFPSTTELATSARQCSFVASGTTTEAVQRNPDEHLLAWLNAEFNLFKMLEEIRYNQILVKGFISIEQLIETANTILNRRKSRAGRSLEHHLGAVFSCADLRFSAQPITEDNKKPDFLFPDAESYYNSSFSASRLTMLAAKTTCKDRWRQILNEADRIRIKHLFTLQQGISNNQLEEMYKYDVQLVVPASHLSSFPGKYKEKILTLKQFLAITREKQLF